jgi:hypothetical protein
MHPEKMLVQLVEQCSSSVLGVMIQRHTNRVFLML